MEIYNPEVKIKNRMRYTCKCEECEEGFDRTGTYIIRGLKLYNKIICQSCVQKSHYTNGTRKSHFGEMNKNSKGKTYEERLGEERGKKFRNTMSKAVSGEKNPMFRDYEHTKGWRAHNDFRKGKTNNEIFGEEKAKEISQNLSLACTGERNPMFGRPSPQGSGNGWSGWYRGFFFRSILELSFLKSLFDRNVRFESGELKKHKIVYEMEGVKRNYFPDFFLLDTGEYIEVKPSALVGTKVNLFKFGAAKSLLGVRFKVVTESEVDRLRLEDLSKMLENGDLKWMKRYEEKWEEKFAKDSDPGRL